MLVQRRAFNMRSKAPRHTCWVSDLFFYLKVLDFS